MVHLKINNIPVEAPEGSTILEAAKLAGINIPTLCYLKEINEIGACRICVVEVKGARSLVAACVYPVNEGMEVFTNTEKVRRSRKTTLELLLSNHKRECLSCIRSTNCELQKLANEYGCDEHRFEGAHTESEPDTSTSYLVRDNEKCILCRRCVAVCKSIQQVGVIAPVRRGFNTHIACALCITAMHQNRTVKYIRANTLLKESDHARQEGRYFEYSNELAAYDLMVIDDFGLMDLDIEKCRDLFEIIESRDCRKATIIISQIPVSGWYQLFGDSTYADACLSRMTSKAYRLEFPGRDRRVNNGN